MSRIGEESTGPSDPVSLARLAARVLGLLLFLSGLYWTWFNAIQLDEVRRPPSSCWADGEIVEVKAGSVGPGTPHPSGGPTALWPSYTFRYEVDGVEYFHKGTSSLTHPAVGDPVSVSYDRGIPATVCGWSMGPDTGRWAFFRKEILKPPLIYGPALVLAGLVLLVASIRFPM